MINFFEEINFYLSLIVNQFIKNYCELLYFFLTLLKYMII